MLQHQPVNYPSLSLSHCLIHSVSLFLSYTLSLSHTLPLSLIHSLSLSFCQTDFTMREGHTHNIEFQTLQSSPSHFQSPPSVVLSLSLSHPRTQSPTHSFSFSKSVTCAKCCCCANAHLRFQIRCHGKLENRSNELHNKSVIIFIERLEIF